MSDKKGWWSTAIISIIPNKILYRGYRVEELIGRLTYGEMVYLLVHGELPNKVIGNLMDALMVAGCDHGALSPAVATARMAATCGIPINCSIATGINLLGDIHGGAGEQCMRLFYEIAECSNVSEESLEVSVAEVVTEWSGRDRFIPGFGHPLHTADPRVQRLLELGSEAVSSGAISGKYLQIAELVERLLASRVGRLIPMNIDGATAALECEIGFTPQTAKGLFALSRAIGILAHVLEESEDRTRLKGPMPVDTLLQEATYTGPPERELP
jgi:citrate synthase